MQLPEVQLIAGNVATYEGARDLIELGVDGVKVGIGPGSICTTRVVSGSGVPQITAIRECARATREDGRAADLRRRHQVLGRFIESRRGGRGLHHDRQPVRGHRGKPRRDDSLPGPTFKSYRGMGSLGAMAQGSSDRYSQEAGGKLVPEGIEGRVPYKGPLSEMVFQLVGGLRAGMGYCGCSEH